MKTFERLILSLILLFGSAAFAKNPGSNPVQGLIIEGNSDYAKIFMTTVVAEVMYPGKKPFVFSGVTSSQTTQLEFWLKDSAGGQGGGMIIVDSVHLTTYESVRDLYRLMTGGKLITDLKTTVVLMGVTSAKLAPGFKELFQSKSNCGLIIGGV